jgi:hypothetical protein
MKGRKDVDPFFPNKYSIDSLPASPSLVHAGTPYPPQHVLHHPFFTAQTTSASTAQTYLLPAVIPADFTT